MKRTIWPWLAILAAMLFSTCSAPTPEMVVHTVEVEREVEKTVEVLREVAVEKVVEKPVQTDDAAKSEPLPPIAGDIPSGAPPRANRLIIKDAELELTVEDTDVAIDRLTQIVDDAGGYIISSRVWYEKWLDSDYKYASLTLGIPVEQFEATMRRLRGIALKVDDERASGQDVTDEYVDLESRLRNLEATRDRIREFLDQAQNV